MTPLPPSCPAITRYSRLTDTAIIMTSVTGCALIIPPKPNILFRSMSSGTYRNSCRTSVIPNAYCSLPMAWKDILLIEVAPTNGRMNIFSGAVLSLWHKYRSEGKGIPTDSELKEASKHISYESVIIEDGTVYFTDKELKIDAGALAKGQVYIYIRPLLRDSGITDYILNLGGNVTVSGKKPDGLWKVGVQDPDGDGLYTKVSVSDISVVTSGDYQRYYEYDGKKYHHIIDLNTLYPASEYRSVTVICRYSWDADALSTALFLMSTEEGEALLRQYNAEALWIKADGTVKRSAGFSAYE